MSNRNILKPLNKETWKKIIKKLPLYAIAFFIPFLILFSIHLCRNAGIGTPIIGTLAVSSILFNGLAGCCFFYYIRHTKAFYLSHISWQLLLSSAYGLCSYAIVQESTTSTLFLYAVFPIVFLSFEAMITDTHYLPFLLLGSLALIADPQSAVPVFLLLLILAFSELKLSNRLTLGNACHQSSCFLLIFLLAAFRIAPHLEVSLSSYSGYNTYCSPLVLLSRFLPGSTASIAYSISNGMDLYFGLFFLIPFFLFFFLKNISKGKRGFYAFFTLLTVFTMYISPFQYVFNLFTEPKDFSLSYSFFLIFWCLKLAGEALSQVQAAAKLSVSAALCMTGALILGSWIGSAFNFPPQAFPVIGLLFILFAILTFCICSNGGNKKPLQVILFFLVFAEFFGNAALITDTSFIPSERNLLTTFIWEAAAAKSDSPTEFTKEDLTEAKESGSSSDVFAYMEEYTDFSSSHTNKEVIAALNQLSNSIPLDSSEYDTYCASSLPNQLEIYNGQCHKLGITDDLFTFFDADIVLTDSDFYTFSHVIDDIYNVEFSSNSTKQTQYYVPFQLKTDQMLPANLYLFNSSTGELFQLTDKNGTGTSSGYMLLINMVNFNVNFQLIPCILNEDMLTELPLLLDAYSEQEENAVSSHFYIYIGLCLSCIGLLIMLSLFFNKDKEKVYQVLLSFKKSLNHWKLPHIIACHMKRNRIYYLSFLIPLGLFVMAMIVTDCIPFGSKFLFNEDGSGLTLPGYLDIYYSLKDENTYLSMNVGYGFSIYANNPLVQLFSFYRLLSANQIAPLLLFGEAVCLGLCGLAMSFYMTHRLKGTKALKTDFRLLVSGMIYALNAYMLSMHNYTGWYFTLFAFPLLILAMDYLMYKKKTLPYVLLLTYCMITNLYLSLYICIFLIIYFFIYHFDGIKDFFRKGMRFALCSLLAAGNSFFIIANTLLSSGDSPYHSSDAVLPSLGLHTSFLEQWKKHMIFTKAPSVSSDNGMLNIYCGIITLLLVLIYFSAKQINYKEKLKKIIPILFLYISFNGQFLSYLWNGFHYQTMVPNRFVFLLLFLLAELAYEAICLIPEISVKKCTILSVFLIGFFLICQFCSEGNDKLSWITTLILCGSYLLLHILYTKYKPAIYPKILVFCLIFELSANMLYATHYFSSKELYYWGDYQATADYIHENLNKDGEYFRIAFPTSWLANTGQVYHTGSGSIFNSFVTNHQVNLAAQYGFYANVNLSTVNYISTPLGMSLSGHRYIFLPVYATGKIEDLIHYEYKGQWDNYYIFENTNAFSLGIYAPKEIAGLTSLYYAPAFFNDIVSLYTENDEPLFLPQYIHYSDDENADNSFYFTDGENNKLTEEQIDDAYADAKGSTSYSSLREFRMHINYTPVSDGFAYLACTELVPLGSCQANVSASKTMNFPNNITDLSSEFYYLIMNPDVLSDFYTEANKNQLENIQIKNDTITGTTNYEKDGYTMLSLACDRSWHAYIDGKEVEIEDPYNSFMLIKTPAGKHTLELKYIPYGMKTSKCITLGFWLLTFLIYVTAYQLKKKKKPLPSE